VVATLTGETVSAQTVSKLTRDLDQAVRQFHAARLADDYADLFLDGVSLRVRRPAGRKRVQMLVAYGVRRDGTRHLLAFLRSQGESQADWEALLQDLYRRGLEGKPLGLIVTDGCAGLAAAIQTVYPQVRHQRCWVHKMRNILEKVRKCDYDEVKTSAQAIYLAESRARAEAAFRAFQARWPGLRQQDNHRHRHHPMCGSHCYSPRGIRRDSRRGRRFDRSRSDPSNPGSRGWPGPRQEHGSPRDRFLALHAGPASRHRDTHFDIRTGAPRRHCRVDSNRRRHPTARVPVRLARA